MTIFSGAVVVSDTTPTLLIPVSDPDQAWELHLGSVGSLVVGDSTVTHSGYTVHTDDHVFRFHGPFYGLYPAGSGGGTVHVLALGQ